MVTEIILVQERGAAESSRNCAQYVAKALGSAGMKMREQVSLCTDKGELQKAIASALGRSNIVIILTGEPGSLAKQVLAGGLRLPLVASDELQRAIRAYCQRTGDPLTPADAELAQIPQGAMAFPGQYGKMPGFAISSANQHILMLPDNQIEAAAMVPKYIIPYLSGSQEQTNVVRTVRTYGHNSEQVRAKLCELLDTANPAVTVEKEGNEVLIRVSAHAPTQQEAAALCTPVLRAVVDRMGDAAYGLDVDSLQTAVVAKLSKKNLDLAVAESGCHSIFTRVLSETPGGPDVLRYSVVADDDNLKIEKLGLDLKLLKKRSGVSEQAAVQMANAVRQKAGADLGCAITVGEAAPGKNDRHPKGLVYIAVCDANNVYVKKLLIDMRTARERDAVIDAALSRAMNMVRLFVDYLPGAYTSAIPLSQALAGKTVTDKDAYDGGKDGSKGKGEKGLLGRLADNFIIRKEDDPIVKVRKVIFILALLVFLGSAVYVGVYYYESYANQKQADMWRNMFGDEDVEISEDFPREYLPQFAALWTINNDVVGYLKIEDTEVEYPVVQADDNDYYLRRNFKRESWQHGIPFLDWRGDIEKPSDNLVIYGHNMKDGQMFGELLDYQDLNYYREHPVIEFSTLYEMNDYKIVSIFITNAYKFAQDTTFFEYHNFADAASDEDFMQFVNQVRIRSLINTPVDVEPGDQLITLSTCTYEFDEARFVIVARKVRDGENSEVDVAQATVNNTPLYPDIWYRIYGGTRPAGAESYTVATQPTSSTPSSTASTPSSTASSGGGAASGTASTPSSTSESESESEAESVSSEVETAQPPESSSQEERSSRSSSGEGTLFDGLDIPSRSSDSGRDGDDGGPDTYVSARGGMSFGVTYQTGSAPGLMRMGANLLTLVPAVADYENAPSIFDFLNDPPDESADTSSNRTPAGTVKVKADGKTISGDASSIIARMVQQELGSNFHEEAIKAQAVAAYTYVRYYNERGQVPTVVLAGKSGVSSRVQKAVDAVVGETVTYKGSIAFTPYHATSAGRTTSSADVWGGSYPYLTSVESAVDKKTTNYKVIRTYSSDEVSEMIYKGLGIETSGKPSTWFDVIDYAEGGYLGRVAVCGETKSAKTGNTITGRMLRENVLGLRSACFDIDYDAGSDSFTFTTYGYGHGVGLSQNGANLYAQQGWDYEKILAHYYPGTSVQ